MLGSSTLFRHTPLRLSNYRWFLRRLDHAAIFLFIAGTYTPFTVGQMGGEWVGPTVAVWAGALIGSVSCAPRSNWRAASSPWDRACL
jgi:hemolysin III